MTRLSRANARLVALYGVGYLALFGLLAAICRMYKWAPGSWMVALPTAASPSGAPDSWQSPAWPALDIKPFDGTAGQSFSNPNVKGHASLIGSEAGEHGKESKS